MGTAACQVQPTTPDEPWLTVVTMNNGRACGPDGLPTQSVKKCFGGAIAHVVLCMVNTSLVTGVVTDSWKLAFIQPIYKCSGANSDPSSFHPTSLRSFLQKSQNESNEESSYESS